MEQKKTKQATDVAMADKEFAKAIDGLTEAMVNDLEKDYHSELEPFEAYATRIRVQIHSNLEEFRDRFLKGYEVLLNELSHSYKEDNKSDEKQPPSGFKV